MNGVIVTKNPNRNPIKLTRLIWLSVFGACLMLSGMTTLSQEVSESENQEKFDNIITEWKAAAKKAAIAGNKFSVASRVEAGVFHEQWEDAVAEGSRQMILLIPVAIDLYKELPNPPAQLTRLLIRIAESEFEKGKYDRAFELSELIIDTEPDNDEVAAVRMGAAVMSNHFEIAKELKEFHADVLDDQITEASRLLADIEVMIEQYDTEKVIREKEAESDDLPRVKIKTTKGTIEVELFENEAPETVGNFISLVEAGAYTDMFFHRVLNHFMAQTGSINGRGQRLNVGYTIYDECGKVDARRHFRGSLSMAKTGEPHSGNSQFFINFAPTPFLDNRHTVFGRVISGWDALDRISRTHELDENAEEKVLVSAVPDRIISATVIRKRDHKYEPVRVD